MLALESIQKEKPVTQKKDAKAKSNESKKSQSKGELEPIRQVVKSKTADNLKKKPVKEKNKKPKLKELKGVRSSKIRKEYANLKVFTLKNSGDEQFKSFSNNFMENERKLEIVQTDVATKMDGIYPNCLMYLEKMNIFIAGSSNHNSTNYLIFIHFTMEETGTEFAIDYMINIPAVDKVTRLSCNSKQSHVVISFNNEYNSCLEIRKRDRRGEAGEKEEMKGVCLWSSNRKDMLMTKKMEKRAQENPEFLKNIPVIKHLWSIEKGFYYKAVDFLKININTLLRSKYWVKNIEKPAKKRLKAIIEKTMKKVVQTSKTDQTCKRKCRWSRSSSCAECTATRKSWSRRRKRD